MKRRQFLVACSASTLTAGCLAGDDADEGTTPTGTSGDSGDVSTAAHVDEARDEFEAAWVTFEEESEKFDDVDNRVSFRTDVIDEHLDRSEAALDRAEESASAEQQTEIDALRDVLDWSRSIVSAFDNVGNAVDEYATATSYLDNERFEDAAERFSAAVDYLDDAESNVTQARASYENMDETTFEDYDEVDALELELLIDDLEALVVDFRYLSRALERFALGYHSFEAGTEAFDDERYRDAADRFGDARGEFTTAHSITTEGEADASDDFIDDFIGFSCLTDALADAAGNFESASEAAQRGNRSRVESEFEDAEAALDRCEYDV